MRHTTPHVVPLRRRAVSQALPVVQLVPSAATTTLQVVPKPQATLPTCPYAAADVLRHLADEPVLELAPLLKQALRQWPLNPTVLATVGDTAMATGNTAIALKAYQRWCRVQPTQSRACFSLALAHEANHDWPAAQAQYQQALALDASYLAAYHNLGTLYMHTGQAALAIALFRSLKQRYPQYHLAVLGLAMAYDTAGDTKTASRRYRQFLALCPTSQHIPHILSRLAEVQRSSVGYTKRTTYVR
jgi:Flp pilus assembly protein TadD